MARDTRRDQAGQRATLTKKMKRSIIVALVVGLVSSVGILARAEDAPGAHQTANERDPTTVKKPAKGTTQSNSPKTDALPQSAAETACMAAQEKAWTEYLDAKARCDSRQGEALLRCVRDAKTARTEALAQAKAQWRAEGR